jgi:hypothetical protein
MIQTGILPIAVVAKETNGAVSGMLAIKSRNPGKNTDVTVAAVHYRSHWMAEVEGGVMMGARVVFSAEFYFMDSLQLRQPDAYCIEDLLIRMPAKID